MKTVRRVFWAIIGYTRGYTDAEEALKKIVIRRGPPSYMKPSFNFIDPFIGRRQVFLRSDARSYEVEHEILAAMGGLTHTQVDALQESFIRNRPRWDLIAKLGGNILDHSASKEIDDGNGNGQQNNPPPFSENKQEQMSRQGRQVLRKLWRKRRERQVPGETDVMSAEENRYGGVPSALDQYFRNISEFELLKPEEVSSLALRSLEGDLEARQRLIESNLAPGCNDR